MTDKAPEANGSTEATKGAVDHIKKETRQALECAKKNVNPNEKIAQLFQELMRDFGKLNTKERIKKIGEILFIATFGRFAESKKEEVPQSSESEPKESKPSQKTVETTDVVAPPSPAPKNPATLPEDLNLKDTKWTKENILKCQSFEQCQALMKTNGFVLDEGTGNYINPQWLDPKKILHEPLITGRINGKKVSLKRSVMKRLKAADEAMFKETGEHIKVGEHFRSNREQFKLYQELKSKGGRVAKPGNSFHEIGQAVDLPLNWQKAEKYMWAQGFRGGSKGLKNDANHFSINEMG